MDPERDVQLLRIRDPFEETDPPKFPQLIPKGLEVSQLPRINFELVTPLASPLPPL